MGTNTGAWGIHAGKTGDAEALFRRGYAPLGWRAMGDLDALAPTREAFRARFEQVYPGNNPRATPGEVGQLFRFVHEAENGDLLVYRSLRDGLVHLFVFSGDYVYRPEIEPGYPHLRSITRVASVPATSVSESALRELGVPLSFFGIKRHLGEWTRVLAAQSRARGN